MSSTAMSFVSIQLAGLAAFLGACRAVANPDPTMNQPPAPSVLSSADLMGFAATTDGPRCRAFYERILGLRVHSEDPMAIVLDACGHVLRIQKLRTHTPQPFTVLGWRVRDIRAAATAMTTAGVRFERVPSRRTTWGSRRSRTGPASPGSRTRTATGSASRSSPTHCRCRRCRHRALGRCERSRRAADNPRCHEVLDAPTPGSARVAAAG